MSQSACASQKRAVRKAEDLLIDKPQKLLMPFGTNQRSDARRHAGSGVGGPAQAGVMTWGDLGTLASPPPNGCGGGEADPSGEALRLVLTCRRPPARCWTPGIFRRCSVPRTWASSVPWTRCVVLRIMPGHCCLRWCWLRRRPQSQPQRSGEGRTSLVSRRVIPAARIRTKTSSVAPICCTSVVPAAPGRRGAAGGWHCLQDSNTDLLGLHRSLAQV
jgi:hypothetical protein